MELMHRGSLREVILNQPDVIDESMMKRFALDIAQGMHFLHSINIIHRDLKSKNLLVNKEWTIKVGDFGSSRLKEADMTQEQGTLLWMAPEVLDGHNYTEKADVYSFGIVLWEIQTKSKDLPFSGMPGVRTPWGIRNAILSGSRPPLSDSCFLGGLITRCWAPDFHERPSFSDVLTSLEQLSPIGDDLEPSELFFS
eukprot:TRINITY_DN18666_c0_g1_i1.p1 TRINITY_DN18666_c0_g1~~TRINITY_DN18666_c0_g1_i1.p1  ORF type:complete len:196 (-),score=20.43 TRINITY_DN18666_c0_g1_i1:21-608(-)